MNKIYNSAAFILITMICFSSCKKEGTQFELHDGQFPAALTASANSVALSFANENDSVIKFDWPAVSFGENPIVSYTLQLDIPSDTTASNNWANAKNYPIDKSVFHFGFTGRILNDLFGSLGLVPGSTHDIVFRIKADVNQSNGAASTVKPAYTNTVAASITSYEPNLYVPGDYQGWDPGAAPVFTPVSGRPGMYEGYINITAGGQQYFKFTNAPDWNHTNYGDGGNGTFDTNGNAGGLSVNGPGYYELTADLNANKWTATKTTWGIIGDASPGGWNNDTEMTYDPTTQVWTATLNMIHNGSFKFRANNAWSIDFGIDGNGQIQYADNPFLGYNGSLNNLSVPEDGNYTITLDLHISQHYSFILHKN